MVFRESRMFPLSDSDLNVIPSLEVPTTRHPFPLISEIRTMRISNRFEKHIVAAATVAMTAAAANAGLVTWNANLVIPNNIDGQYINVETQTAASAAGLVAGWDLNPYGTSKWLRYGPRPGRNDHCGCKPVRRNPCQFGFNLRQHRIERDRWWLDVEFSQLLRLPIPWCRRRDPLRLGNHDRGSDHGRSHSYLGHL